MEHKGTGQLHTDHLLLRPFALEDAESCIRNWATDEAVYRYIGQSAQRPQEIYDWLSSAGDAYASSETYFPMTAIGMM